MLVLPVSCINFCILLINLLKHYVEIGRMFYKCLSELLTQAFINQAWNLIFKKICLGRLAYV